MTAKILILPGQGHYLVIGDDSLIARRSERPRAARTVERSRTPLPAERPAEATGRRLPGDVPVIVDDGFPPVRPVMGLVPAAPPDAAPVYRSWQELTAAVAEGAKREAADEELHVRLVTAAPLPESAVVELRDVLPRRLRLSITLESPPTRGDDVG